MEQNLFIEQGTTAYAFANPLKRLAHPTGFEPVTSAFGGQRSIHKPLKTLSFSQIYLI
tara:strand:- start:197 stop:370 length:174 start_codon:yes stop_codon:yes gene_type:complete